MIAQVQLINKILETKDFSVITSNGLTDEYFYDTKAEFNFIKNHLELYKKVPDIMTFKATFPSFEIETVEEPLTYIMEQLYNEYNTSYLAQRFNKIKPMLESGQTDSAVQYFMESVEGLHTGSVLTCTDILEDTSRYDHYLDRTINHDKYYLSTGFAELDRILGGIDRENENMIIMARPGQGKTQLLLKIAAEAAKQGMRVGIFEGEMTVDKVGYRLDTFIEGISNTAMNRGDVDINQQYKRYIDTLKNRHYGPIKILTLNDIPSGECTVDVLRAFAEKEKLDVVFVDQYDLMEDKHKTNVEHEHVAYIAKDMKKLQVEKKIPIISVCQMTRSKLEDKDGNKVQDTSQAAGSDKISRYATTMLALDQEIKEDETGRKHLELTVRIVKARDGGDHNKLTYITDFNTGYFEYIGNENDGITSKEDFKKLKDSYEVVDPAEGEFVY